MTAGDLTFSLQVTVAPGRRPARATSPSRSADAELRSSTTTTTAERARRWCRTIAEIQGALARSPFEGQLVTTHGIVTARKTNGFFIQTPDAEADSDPATSEGIFVFTGAAPPAVAAVGNDVAVTGTVQEFVPGADPVSPPITELSFSPVGVPRFRAATCCPTPDARWRPRDGHRRASRSSTSRACGSTSRR